MGVRHARQDKQQAVPHRTRTSDCVLFLRCIVSRPIAQGTADKIVPVTEAHKIKKLVPQAKYAPIEGASHYLPLEDGAWQEVVDNIIPFLSGTEGRRSQR